MKDFGFIKDYYKILGIKKGATLEEIKAARENMKFGDSKVSYFMWPMIDEAYNVLSNPEKRKEYDKAIDDFLNAYALVSKKEEEEPIKEEEEPIKEEEIGLVFDDKNRPKKEKITLSKGGKVIKLLGGTLVPYAAFSLLGFQAIGTVIAAGVILNAISKKRKKVKLQKENKQKEITKITTKEMVEIEDYNETLDNQINKLLSEPHNNYRLQICKVKYENQIVLLENLLQMKLNKKVDKFGMIRHKLDLAATKIQLETAKRNLVRINEKIGKYEREQGLTRLNQELIETNQKLAERKAEKSDRIRNLQAYQSHLLNKRDKKAKRKKIMVVKSGKVYDSILKAKDFIVSLPYMFRSTDALEELMSDEIQKSR